MKSKSRNYNENKKIEESLPPANFKRENQNVNCRMFRNMGTKTSHKESIVHM